MSTPDLQRLLTAPILPTLLRMAAPNVLAMVMTVLVGIAETYYVGLMGTTPLGACRRPSAEPWVLQTWRAQTSWCNTPC
jgi:hypothetical protein